MSSVRKMTFGGHCCFCHCRNCSVAVTIVAADYVAAAMRLKRPNTHINENLKTKIQKKRKNVKLWITTIDICHNLLNQIRILYCTNLYDDKSDCRCFVL
jgi:hypothetical protein